MKNLILSILTSAAILIPGVAFAAPLTSTSTMTTETSNMSVCAMPDAVGDFQANLLGDATFDVTLSNLVGNYQVFNGDTITLDGEVFPILHTVDDLPAVCLAALADEIANVTLTFSINNADWSLSYNQITAAPSIADLETSSGSYNVTIPQLVLTYNGDYADFVDASLILSLDGSISATIDSDAPITDTANTVINTNPN